MHYDHCGHCDVVSLLFETINNFSHVPDSQGPGYACVLLPFLKVGKVGGGGGGFIT